MRFDVLTIFPAMIEGPLSTSIIGRARTAGLVTIATHDVRDYTDDKHRRVDDTPFGGGAGMVMNAQPFFATLREGLGLNEKDHDDAHIVLLTPQGQVFSQAKAAELAGKKRLVLLCGHYEGIDDRVRQTWVDEELSIGDYVLTGGELAALVVIDAVARLLPGVLGHEASSVEESFSDQLLEYPQYTRPAEFEGMTVPDVLLSGHHGRINNWRRQQSLVRTYKNRPDLLQGRCLSFQDGELLRAGLQAGGMDAEQLEREWQALALTAAPAPRTRKRRKEGKGTNE
ncbi:tRNA (guanosine(37)-N1)-methyltransferase TrmD [Heliophilum fasciatum]|uniref:tRNA (guanine-N(1)-)-methyltransferase n=1 Tax=Heliophilum fasciatum TaxID=35700 RepID=A0A4R2RX04_9FIRM|nr:tRNA (guanosine(37)-N1)-methyltransferase TrmD [Heliophilum fasciatum]MCW2278436.1 tRNA (guanine37-N1)-methyltransferase [Heliophilum fasciatum]TCP63665.1 tRNA (guanine37-N(1)-) methyltransferase [Heliophilum fasciatum]